MSQRPKKKQRGEASSSSARKNKLPPSTMARSQMRSILNFDTPLSELSTEQRCELIAEISEAVLEDPQGAFTSHTPQHLRGENDNANSEDDPSSQQYLNSHSKMRRLLDIATPINNGHDPTTTKLAMLSLLAIFQDILPSYRIRLPTEAEMAVRVSKDTKLLWDYERSLLTSYQQYLKLLNQLWDDGKAAAAAAGKKGGGSSSISPLSVAAILCLCELLKSASHFNFRSNILSVVVKQMNNSSCEEVSNACCASISHVFENDVQGEIALEATKLISKVVKDRSSTNGSGGVNIRPAVLRTFFSLPLRVHEDEAQAAKLASEANAKKRRKDRDSDDLDKDLKEGDATVDKIVLARSQADTLHSVTLTYFRILKSVENYITDERNANKQNRAMSATIDLLAPSLEGLARFGHLINFDTMVDLLKVLKDLLKSVELLPLEASLNCVLTSFQTLQGAGRELQIDQKEYVNPLYSQLPRLIGESMTPHHTELAIKCLEAAFIKRKEYSSVRVAAFLKQLCTVCLHAPPFSSAPLLAFVRQLLHRYPSAAQLLENEQEIIASGAYTPNAADVEHTNPFATSAWELGTLRFHINPSVVQHASGASQQKMLAFPLEEPSRILANSAKDDRENYVSYKFNKKKHPLAQNNRGKQRDRRNRQQVRFITPRKTDNLKQWLR